MPITSLIMLNYLKSFSLDNMVFKYDVHRHGIEQLDGFFSNIIGLLERRNKRKSVLEITKMYYFKI